MANNPSENDDNAVSICGGQLSSEHSSQPKYYLVAPQNPLRQQKVKTAVAIAMAENDVDTNTTSEFAAVSELNHEVSENADTDKDINEDVYDDVDDVIARESEAGEEDIDNLSSVDVNKGDISNDDTNNLDANSADMNSDDTNNEDSPADNVAENAETDIEKSKTKKVRRRLKVRKRYRR